MKIKIKPFQQFIPGKGMLTATHLEVSIGQYELGARVSGNYELQAEVPPAPDAAAEAKPTYQALLNGRAALTAEQFAAWGTDDAVFCNAVATNAGLTPA